MLVTSFTSIGKKDPAVTPLNVAVVPLSIITVTEASLTPANKQAPRWFTLGKALKHLNVALPPPVDIVKVSPST